MFIIIIRWHKNDSMKCTHFWQNVDAVLTYKHGQIYSMTRIWDVQLTSFNYFPWQTSKMATRAIVFFFLSMFPIAEGRVDNIYRKCYQYILYTLNSNYLEIKVHRSIGALTYIQIKQKLRLPSLPDIFTSPMHSIILLYEIIACHKTWRVNIDSLFEVVWLRWHHK